MLAANRTAHEVDENECNGIRSITLGGIDKTSLVWCNNSGIGIVQHRCCISKATRLFAEFTAEDSTIGLDKMPMENKNTFKR
jgi:hypothetical protein